MMRGWGFARKPGAARRWLGYLGGLALCACNIQGNKSLLDLGFRPGLPPDPTSGPAPVLTLTSVLPTATDDSAAAFARGSSTGVAWDGVNHVMKLGNSGGCDGAAENCAELSSGWTPQWGNIVGYWKFDESSGSSTAIDSGPIGTNLGSATNVTFGSDGKVASAAAFNGSSSAINVTMTPDLNPGAGDFTVAAWFKTSVSATQIIVGATGGGFDYWLGTSGGDYHFSINGNSVDVGSAHDGKFHHIVGVRHSGIISLYVDGQNMGNTTYGGNCAPVAVPLGLGWGSGWGSYYWNGTIDEVAIWKSSLSGPEISAIYNRQSPGVTAKYAGITLSRIMDAGSSKAWSNFSWLATLPFGKELPDGGLSESSVDYSSLVGSDGTTATHDLMRGNVGLWHLNDGSGTAFHDSSGNSKTGTSLSTISGSTGIFSTSALFDGSNYVTVPIIVSETAYAASLWFRTSAVGQGLMEVDTGLGDYDRSLYLDGSGNACAYIYTGGVETICSSGTSYADGSWHQVLHTFGGTVGAQKLYVDGVLATTGSVSASAFTWQNKVALGYTDKAPVSHILHGQLDEVALWSRSLSPNEIKQLYQRGASRLKFQIKSCAIADCSDGLWQGPDGSGQTYFSELNNNSVPLALSGSVLATLPNMLLSVFTSAPSPSRYFQYRAIFEADDSDVTLGPQLKNVEVKTAAAQVLPSYTATGTCSENGAAVTVTVSDGTRSANGSGICTAGTYSAIVDVTGFNDGTLTITASSTANGATGTATGTYTGSNTALPANATTLGWAEGTSTTNFIINATWTPSTSSDLRNQIIQFYTGSCAATSGSAINLGSATVATRAFTGTNGNSYSYKITSIDSAGNSQTSGCSSFVMETAVLTDNSNSATSPSFNGGSQVGTAWVTDKLVLDPSGVPTNNAELDASWTPQWNSLVSYWKMNNDWNDSKGTNNGVASGVTFSNPKMGSAAGLFDGTHSVSASSASNLALTGDFTLMAWVKSGTGTFRGILSRQTGSSGSAFSGYSLLKTNTDNFAFWTMDLGTFTGLGSDRAYPDLGWHHVVAVRRGGTNFLYVDGQVQTTTNTQTVSSTGGPFYIGQLYSDLPSFFQMDGLIDEAGVWAVGLSDIEVQNIYARQSARYAGQIVSRVFNYGSADAWTSVKWFTTLPFGKELPDNGVSESSTHYSSLTGSTGSTSDNDLMSGIVGLWHLDEMAGTTGTGSVLDKSSEVPANNGTPSNVAFGANGKSGTAATFNGSSSNIAVASSTNLELTNGTLSAWIYPNWSSGGAGYDPAILAYRDGSGTRYSLHIEDDYSKIAFYNGIAPFYFIEPLSRGNWYHVVLTESSGQLSAYLNGVQVGSPQTAPFGTATGVPLNIGSSTGSSEWFNGTIDEVAIWNRSLSPAEVMELYRRGANRIKFQVRSCTASDCSDNPSWQGPDNSNQTYFSELHNNTAFKLGGNNVFGDVLAGAPDMIFQYFSSLWVPARQYFQYRAILESDDTGTACGGSWCSPELKSVTVTP